MSGFADDFPDSELMIMLGDDVIYIASGGGSAAIKAVVDKDVERVGNDGYTLDPRTEIEFLKSDITGYPKRGDTITYNADSFTVESVLLDDGHYVRVAVK